MKKRQWSIRRTTTQAPEAQRRWDRAYQHLLQWSAPTVSVSPKESQAQENHHEQRGLRPRFDTTTSPDPDNRTATRQVAELS